MIRITTIAAALLIGLRPRRARRGAGGAASHATPRSRSRPGALRASSAPSTSTSCSAASRCSRTSAPTAIGARCWPSATSHEEGGPDSPEEQVKALAAELRRSPIRRPKAASARASRPTAGRRQLSDADAIAAFGVVPPDFSVIAKARGIDAAVPVVDLQLLHGLPGRRPGLHPCPDARLPRPAAGRRRRCPTASTTTRSSRATPSACRRRWPTAPSPTRTRPSRRRPTSMRSDVSAFLMWLAEPHLVARKESGLRVMVFLLLFAGLMWFVKQKLWGPIHRHNPSPDEVAAAGVATAPPSRSSRAAARSRIRRNRKGPSGALSLGGAIGAAVDLSRGSASATMRGRQRPCRPSPCATSRSIDNPPVRRASPCPRSVLQSPR